MKKIIEPITQIKGHLQIPASKSYAQRVLAAALLAKGKTHIARFGNSDDELAALAIIEKAGAQVQRVSSSELIITSQGLGQRDFTINCGESGLAARMFTPIMALGSGKITIEGEGSLKTRPMSFFDTTFEALEVNFQSSPSQDQPRGYLPLSIQGPLHPKTLILDGSASSQFITGIIFAFAASPKLGTLTIQLQNPKSLPYIRLTLDVLQQFGVTIELTKNALHFCGPYQLKPSKQTIEGDWSSASFMLVAAALYGSVTISNLNAESQQADRAILTALTNFGANVKIEAQQITVEKDKARPFQFDATHCPDLFPPLAALAALTNGVSAIKGISRLIHKESNRAKTIQSEFKKMGINISLQEDYMLIHGRPQVLAATVQSHGDHRIAMACAILALKAKGPVTIEQAEAVNKSYPNFFEQLEAICIP